ncbi:MAG TPA: hypothetical protein DET40_14725 [Lentisphaeria bacterium]|nr:MAG: hypothetical protein A2X45_05895 [Lentisphaerae bacterium GWF2_50_93]HCE44792.1 hypothetical protein [Lentisphaeria bacterium]
MKKVNMKPIGLQLYSVREVLGESKESFLSTMKKVSEIGFVGVEGGLGEAVKFGMTAEQYKELLDQLGLEMITGPGPKHDLSNIEEIGRLKKIFGFKYLFGGFGWDEFKTMDSIRKTAELINRMTAAIKPHKLELSLHNHFWEFDRINGRIAQEYIAELCPDVKFEIDIYWATNFGANDAAEQVKNFRSRVPILHIKDGMMERPKDQPFGGPMSAVGAGKVNVKGAIAAADPKLLKWLVVEIDRCEGDRMEAVEASYRYLAANKLGKGSVK